jgi:hypothetical protein
MKENVKLVTEPACSAMRNYFSETGRPAPKSFSKGDAFQKGHEPLAHYDLTAFVENAVIRAQAKERDGWLESIHNTYTRPR